MKAHYKGQFGHFCTSIIVYTFKNVLHLVLGFTKLVFELYILISAKLMLKKFKN
jgi:hypothetical protein